MKKFRQTLAVLFLVLALAMLVPVTAPCSTPMPEEEAAAKTINAFAIDLYRQIRKPEGNLIFSPYSVSVALAMA
jgi:serine protease inhibitor